MSVFDKNKKREPESASTNPGSPRDEEHRETEAALRASQARLAGIIDSAMDAIITIDSRQKIIVFNRGAEAMLRCSKAEALGQPLNHFIPDRYRTAHSSYVQAFGETGVTSRAMGGARTVRGLRADGEEFSLEASISQFEADGQNFYTVIMRDITQLRRAEEQLIQVIESAPHGMVMVDQKGAIVLVNSQIENSFGYSRDELLGRTVEMLVPARFRERHPAYRDDFVAHPTARPMGAGRDLFGLRKDGTEFPVEIGLNPIETEQGKMILSTVVDITARKRAGVELENERRRLNNIIASVPGVVWEAWGKPDAATQRTDFVNDYVETMLGYSVAEWLSTPNFWLSIVHPEDRARTAQAAAADFARGKESTLEFRWVTKDGRAVWVESNSTLVCDAEGKPAGLRGVTMDITERKLAEERNINRAALASLRADIIAGLAESDLSQQVVLNRCAAALVQNLDAAFVRIWILNREENVLELQASAGLYTHLDGAHSRVPVGSLKIGRIAQDLRPHITNEVQSDPLVSDKEWAKREAIVSFAGYPLMVRDRLVGVMALFSRHELAEDALDALAAMAEIISQDIERKRIEEALRVSEDQLRQSQKLEAIGMLAGGIAHDFNNLLTTITGYSELALRRLRIEDPLHRNISEVKTAADRAASLTRQLLAFSRKQVLQPKIINLNMIVSELEKMLRRLIGEDVDLRVVIEEGLGNVKADPGQIEQVLMNLAVNARDAMPEGGKLTIETTNVYLDDRYARKHLTVIPGHYVMLAVSDTGTGMDENTQAHIFEPFFTTKEVGKGTGLGLSTVYGIVKQSGGNIWVYSEPGSGTSFKIYFPRVDERPRDSSPKAAAEANLQGTETILLTEDEDMVRTLAREVLEMYGYRVLEAANAGAALLICERHLEPIQLLLTDVVMPEMGGHALANRLKLIKPDMKVLFMSGYTDNAIVHQGFLDEGANFIQKPFSPDAMARKVREVLDGE